MNDKDETMDSVIRHEAKRIAAELQKTLDNWHSGAAAHVVPAGQEANYLRARVEQIKREQSVNQDCCPKCGMHGLRALQLGLGYRAGIYATDTAGCCAISRGDFRGLSARQAKTAYDMGYGEWHNPFPIETKKNTSPAAQRPSYWPKAGYYDTATGEGCGPSGLPPGVVLEAATLAAAPACECGAHTAGHTAAGPAHSRWCPLYA